MENDVFEMLAAVISSILALIIGVWGVLKLFYRFRSKFLFITNCQILHKSIWKDIRKRHKVIPHGEQDHAFRPLVLLPDSLKNYFSIKNGDKAVLESINISGKDNLKIIVEVFWIPSDMER